MDIFSAFKKVVFQNYCNFNGRAKRAEYWWYALAAAIISFALSGLQAWGYMQGDTGTIIFTSALYYVVLLALVLPGLGVTWRRLHDIGKGGQWYWIFLIPIIGAIWLLVLLCMPSEPQDNRFGPYE